ncbi:MAG: hypothetical protein U5J95_02860 [Balneolaceae bacterium]|nr:hypothetical protein [Balneolaceae bacterium]
MGWCHSGHLLNYVPLNVKNGIHESEAIAVLQPLFETGALKIAHNYKFDYMMLNRAGLEISGTVFDTMVAGYLIDANQKLKMDTLSKKYLNYEPISIEKLDRLRSKAKNYGSNSAARGRLPPMPVQEDADITLRLYEGT